MCGVWGLWVSPVERERKVSDHGTCIEGGGRAGRRGHVVFRGGVMASAAESAGSAPDGASQCVPDKSTIAQCFPDKALAQAIASQLKGDKGRTGEVLTSKDVKDTTAFPLSWLSLREVTAGISSVQGLQVFTNLTYLDLCGTRVSDVSPLSKLVNLRGLQLNDTQVSDVSPLSKLVNLEGLNLCHTQVSDVSPLSKLHLASSSKPTTRNVRPSVKLTVNAVAR